MATPEPLLTPAEAAAYLRVAVQTLAKWRSLHQGPPYRTVGRRLVRYRREDLEAWVQAQQREHSSAPGTQEGPWRAREPGQGAR